MQIQLKQAEIVSALKQYITSQGINLQGKTVDISFTAGRGTSGLTADLIIEDAAIPALDFDGSDDAKAKPVLGLVPPSPILGAVASLAIPETEKVLEERVPEAKPATGTEEAAPVKATTSLFS